MPTIQDNSFTIENHNVFFNVDSVVFCKVSGHDRERYLQGRITQNIKQRAALDFLESLLLSPQGKIQSRFDIVVFEDHYLLLIEEMDKEVFGDALLQFKVADDVNLDFVEKDYSLVSVQGPHASDIISALSTNVFDPLSDKAQVISIADKQIIVFPKKRSISGGYDLILESNQQTAVLETLSSKDELKQIDKQESETLRILAGIPSYGSDMGTDVMATEVPHQNLISFKKGCYAGQEAVEMSIARGRPNRTLIRLRGESGLKMEPSTPVFSNEKLELKVGKITSHSPSSGLFLALVKTKNSELSEFWTEQHRLLRIE